MNNRFNNLYEFGDFRFDGPSATLWRGGEMVALPPKASEVLRLLIENNGRLVSKQELLETVWADTFVEEGVLTQSIYILRQTLGTEADGTQFIQTVARRGYRLNVTVKILETDAGKTEQTFAKNLQVGVNRVISPEFSVNETEHLTVRYLAEEPSPKNIANAKARNVTLFWSGLGVLLISVIAIIVAIIFFANKISNRATVEADQKFAPIEQIRFQRLTDTGDVVFPTISPKGELLAYVRLADQEGSVWVKQIATGSAAQILPPSRKGFRSLAFSPDGNYLYFREEINGSGIYRTPILGGTPKRVADNAWSDFSVSPDGTQVAFLRRASEGGAHQLILSKTDGTAERELAVRRNPLDFRGTPAWSPDGAKIVLVGGVGDEIFPKLLTIEATDGTETELQTPRWRAIPRAVFSADGKHLIVSARENNESNSQIWMLSFAGGEVRRLTNDLESYFWLSLSQDGKLLVSRQQRIISHLWILPDGDAKSAKQITFGERNFDGYVGLSWTPDGKLIYSVRSGNVTDLYKIDADGGNRVQLTANAGQDNTYPSVTSDGKYVVFTSNRTGTTQIWRMETDGRNPKQMTFGDLQNERSQSPAVSPDSREIYFIRRGEKPSAIWKVSIDGGEPKAVSNLTNGTPEGFLAVSPDGRLLAYRHLSRQPENTGDQPTMRIGLIRTDGQGEPKFFDLPLRRPLVQWANDSKSFDYSAGTFNSSSFMRKSVDNEVSEKLFDLNDRIFNFAWSPDRKNLVLARGRQLGDALLITNLP